MKDFLYLLRAPCCIIPLWCHDMEDSLAVQFTATCYEYATYFFHCSLLDSIQLFLELWTSFLQNSPGEWSISKLKCLGNSVDNHMGLKENSNILLEIESVIIKHLRLAKYCGVMHKTCFVCHTDLSTLPWGAHNLL